MINPLKFRRSQDFSIVSLITIKCNESVLTRKLWKIRNCSIRNCSNEIQLNSKIILNQSEIFVPSRILSFGIYEFELIVSMRNYPTVKSSSFVYVEITSSRITANLVQLRTSMITSGVQQDLKLNPGEFSVDQDENSFDKTVSSFVFRFDYQMKII